jgi:RND family efflux transporter MFP subunit
VIKTGMDNEEQLRAEISALRGKLAEQERQLAHNDKPAHQRVRKPSTGALIGLAVFALIALVVAFFMGYMPLQQRQSQLVASAKDDVSQEPIVNTYKAGRASGVFQLVLPGNIQAVTEAPILARATGYLKRRLVDIGDHVKEGQLLAEVDAPELTQQLLQARAALEQAKAVEEQANASLEQGKANEQLARTTAERYANLVQRGAVSKQENDNYQAQHAAQKANVLALGKAVNAARSSVAAVAANVSRLVEVESRQRVIAPFSGVVTVRNVDTGALVNEGSTLLFRIAQTSRLRTYINVPQAEASGMKVGVRAVIKVPDLPSKEFSGTITHTADALDPSSRTLLAEVQVDNAAGLLMPGMYAQVFFKTPRREPPVTVRAEALLIRANGPQVAIVKPDGKVHIQLVQLGRDSGESVEVLSGLKEGDQVIINAGDNISEGAKVKANLMKTPGRAGK